MNDSFVSALTRGGLRKEPAKLAVATATSGEDEALAIAFAGGAAAGGRSTTDAFDGGEDEDFAKAAHGGGTTTRRGFASAVAGYRLFAGGAVAPATSDEDEAFAKALVAGGATTTRRGTKDAFAG